MADKNDFYKLLLKDYAIGGLFIVVGLSVVGLGNSLIGFSLVFSGLIIACVMKGFQYRKAHPSFLQNIELLYDLLEENRNFFQNYGPNSSAGSTTILRTELQLKLWESARSKVIRPNNQKILSVINEIEKQFDSEERCVIDVMKKHIYAFEEHCNDLSIDYSGHQFPVEFTNLIVQKLSGPQNPLELTEKYREWLLTENAEIDNIITEMFVFGSSLYHTNPKDIDVVISYKGTPQQFQIIVTAIKSDFKDFFNIPVHITAFSHAEIKECMRFKQRCGEIIEIVSEQ